MHVRLNECALGSVLLRLNRGNDMSLSKERKSIYIQMVSLVHTLAAYEPKMKDEQRERLDGIVEFLSTNVAVNKEELLGIQVVPAMLDELDRLIEREKRLAGDEVASSEFSRANEGVQP